jgi:hypothetical protein
LHPPIAATHRARRRAARFIVVGRELTARKRGARDVVQ